MREQLLPPPRDHLEGSGLHCNAVRCIHDSGPHEATQVTVAVGGGVWAAQALDESWGLNAYSCETMTHSVTHAQATEAQQEHVCTVAKRRRWTHARVHSATGSA